ncbi:MAG TPA: hypothetical protein VIT23_04250 [Terrimicrobiaceae bacterium]
MRCGFAARPKFSANCGTEGYGIAVDTHVFHKGCHRIDLVKSPDRVSLKKRWWRTPSEGTHLRRFFSNAAIITHDYRSYDASLKVDDWQRLQIILTHHYSGHVQSFTWQAISCDGPITFPMRNLSTAT